MTTMKYFTSQYFERWKAPSSCHQTDSPERKSAVRLEAFYIGEERSLCCAKKINTRERERERDGARREEYYFQYHRYFHEILNPKLWFPVGVK